MRYRTQTNRNDLNDPDYRGKRDYQGRHDVFEMPEQQKPSRRLKLPVKAANKVALAVILVCVAAVLILTCASLIQQSASL